MPYVVNQSIAIRLSNKDSAYYKIENQWYVYDDIDRALYPVNNANILSRLSALLSNTLQKDFQDDKYA